MRPGSYKRIYLGQIAAAPPAGLVLVHSFSAPTPGDERSGQWWHQKPDERLLLCECGAAPQAGPHYLLPRKVW
jgi:hypothetical protein